MIQQFYFYKFHLTLLSAICWLLSSGLIVFNDIIGYIWFFVLLESMMVFPWQIGPFWQDTLDIWVAV